MSEDTELARQLLSHPGDTLQETLDELNMSQIELAVRMGRPIKTINEIVKGKAGITADTALQLERVLGITSVFWLNLEKEYRRELAEIEDREKLENSIDWLKEFPVAAMHKLGWIENTTHKPRLVINMLGFFGVASPEQWKEIYVDATAGVAFRISLAHTSHPGAISAWLRKGWSQARHFPSVNYNKSLFKEKLQDCRELAYTQPDDYKEQLQTICAKAGVLLVYTPNLPNATISGSTRWMGDNPLIQLSGQYKTNDHFWFTFFHEAGHILLHGKKDIFLENVKGGQVEASKEQEADEYAAKTLIPPRSLSAILERKPLNKLEILNLAHKLRIHPGIIVGQLQHKKEIDYNMHNAMKVKINVE